MPLDGNTDGRISISSPGRPLTQQSYRAREWEKRTEARIENIQGGSGI